MIPVNWMAPQLGLDILSSLEKILTCVTNNIIHTSPYSKKSEAEFNKTRYQKYVLSGLMGAGEERQLCLSASLLSENYFDFFVIDYFHC